MGHEWKVGDWAESGSKRYFVWDVSGSSVYGIAEHRSISWFASDETVKHLPNCTGWDWEEPKAKEPPPGYRLLTEGDTLIDSDIYLSWDGTWKNCIVSDKIPRGVGPSSTLYARKIETTIEPPPGYRLLGRDDIVDYGDILIARDANNCDLWKAVDGDKYGNTVGCLIHTCNVFAVAREIEEPKPVDPPPGYRLMNADETIRHGDMFWDGEWRNTGITCGEIPVGEALKKYARYKIAAYACRIETDAFKIVEPKYRPFANAEEFMPHRDRWLVDNDGEMLCIVSFDEKRLKIATRYGSIYFLDAFSRFKFEDGTPFGVLESIS